MGVFTAASVIVVGFPFTDGAAQKQRPVVLLGGVGRGDWIVCPITSKSLGHLVFVKLEASDFRTGGLRVAPSYCVTSKIFTIHESRFGPEIGKITAEKWAEIKASSATLIRNL